MKRMQRFDRITMLTVVDAAKVKSNRNTLQRRKAVQSASKLHLMQPWCDLRAIVKI